MKTANYEEADQMGPLGFSETVFIFVLALLVFGPKKLPELGRTIGKAMTEFRRASSELKATFDREMTQIERENESLKDVTREYAFEEHSYKHDSYYDNGDYHSGSYDYNAADDTSVSVSAPQGADDQAGHQETAVATANGEQKPVESDSVTLEQSTRADDPHSVKS
jgi:sec-independent protein translocase protein TatA